MLTSRPREEDSSQSAKTAAKKNYYGWLMDNVRWAYMNSPINFSFITGYRYPHISRLTGSAFTGRLAQFSKDKGTGNSIDVSVNAANLAKQDPRGMCYWWVAHKFFILVTKPDDLDQVFYKNKDNISRSEILKDTLGIIFGPETLLTIPSNDLWRKKREAAKSRLFTESALKDLAEPMQDIIEEHLSQLPHDHEVDLREFSTSLTLDVMARTQIGTASVKDSIKEVADVYDAAFVETLDHSNLARQKMAELEEYFHKRTTSTPLEKVKYSLHDMLRKHFIKPYGEEIRHSDNIITKVAKLSQQSEEAPDLNVEPNVSDFGLFLLAGFDTTSRLLEHLIMLLDTHPAVLKKLTDEIQANRPATAKWTREDVEKLSYLKMVLNETLRLYPSVPIIGTAVTKSFVLADIPRTSSQEEYQKAMSTRDTTRDVLLQPGDYIMASAYITQRLETQFENPLEFKPERFEQKIDQCAWFPFSIGQRDCIGRRFALQEISLFVIKLVEKYTFKIQEGITHPFTETLIGVLRPAKVSHVLFKPRSETMESSQSRLATPGNSCY